MPFQKHWSRFPLQSCDLVFQRTRPQGFPLQSGLKNNITPFNNHSKKREQLVQI